MIFDLKQFDAVEVSPCIDFLHRSGSEFTESYDSKEDWLNDLSADDLTVMRSYWSVFLLYSDDSGEHGRECVADFKSGEQAELVASALLLSMAGDVEDALRDLRDCLSESHQHEVDNNHFGDGPECSYCRAIKKADAILGE